jgi:asparagine synthase (glutamine-hydrolysing)
MRATNVCGAVHFGHENSPWIEEARLGFGFNRGDDPAAGFLSPSSALHNGAGFFYSSIHFGGRLALVGDISLHNRSDLILELGLRRLPPTPSDSLIVLAAYSKWGSGFPEHLAGEFCLGIWDAQLEQLIVCVDHFASRPVCYWQQGSRFLFSHDPRQILRVRGVERELNTGRLVSMLASNAARIEPGDEDETLHKGIVALPPASILTVDRRSFRLRNYWTPAIRPELVPRDDVQAFEELRGLLKDSVSNRLQGSKSVATTLSGGLDSSALTALAARHLSAANRELLAFSAVLPDGYAGVLQDERQYVDEFRSWPNVRIEYVTAPGKGPFDLIADPACFESSFFHSSRHYLQKSLTDAAISAGADLVMDGQFGELGPTARIGGHYASLAAGFRWSTLATSLLYRENDSEAPPLRRAALRMLVSDFKGLLLPRSRVQPPMVFLAADLRQKWNSMTRIERAGSRTYHLSMVRRYLWKHAIRAGMAPLESIRTSFPLRDKRIVEFCLGASRGMKIRGGYSRYLIRRSLDGILPKKIQWRTDKKPFASDYYLRYNAQLPLAKDFVASIGPGDPLHRLVDVRQLRESLNPADPHVPNFAALIQIPSTIYLICFLRQFTEFR